MEKLVDTFDSFGPPSLGEKGSYDFTTVSNSVDQFVCLSISNTFSSEMAHRIFWNFALS